MRAGAELDEAGPGLITHLWVTIADNHNRRLTVTVPFHDVNEEGMPAREEEYRVVGDIEDRVGDALGRT